MPKRGNEAEVERIEREASRTHGGNQEQIATALYRASVEAHQRGENQLSGALLERALILALPSILQVNDQMDTREQEQ